MRARSLRAVALSAAIVVNAGCDALKELTTPTADPPKQSNSIRTHDAAWITASWSGGRTGSPLESRAITPNTWVGNLCPANSIQLLLASGGFNGLTIRNSCTIPIDIGLCVSAGSGSPGSLEGVSECAKDPLDTPWNRLFRVQLFASNGSYYINSARSLDVNVFYCTDKSTLAAPGLYSGITKVSCMY